MLNGMSSGSRQVLGTVLTALGGFGCVLSLGIAYRWVGWLGPEMALPALVALVLNPLVWAGVVGIRLVRRASAEELASGLTAPETALSARHTAT